MPVRRKRSPLFTVRWVLVSDIDNTLLGDRRALEELLRWIQSRTGEVAFGIATGRTLASTLRVLREWKVPVPDFLITAVGSEIHYGPKRPAFAPHVLSFASPFFDQGYGAGMKWPCGCARARLSHKEGSRIPIDSQGNHLDDSLFFHPGDTRSRFVTIACLGFSGDC